MKHPVVLIVATIVVLAGCAVTPSPTPLVLESLIPTATASPTLAAEVRQTWHNLSFVTPAGWQVVEPRVWTTPTGPLLFVSDAPIADPCPTVFRASECWKPLTQLPPGGILVTIAGKATLGLNTPSASPVVQAVNEMCKEIGGQEQFGAAGGVTNLAVTACLSGPDLAANEAAFARLISSLNRE